MPLLRDLKAAQRLLDDLTHGCLIPAATQTLSPSSFQANGHVLIGDIPVRGYKHKGRWRLMEEDVRHAGRMLAGLIVDTAALDPVQLPSQRGRHRPPTPGFDWRSRILDRLDHAAYVQRSRHGCGREGKPCPPDDEGLPCGMAWTTFLQWHSNFTIASTQPLPLMSWSGRQWLLPRAYAALLDRAEQAAERLSQKAATCTTCGAAVDRWTQRTSSAAGFVTVCSPCANLRYRPYTGHLRGVRYDALGKHLRADDYLCCLCRKPRRAYYWDHCHDHGYVRGPVCASCNTREGGGWQFVVGADGGGLEHLLRCTGCRLEGSLPRRHHADIVAAAVEPAPHDGCSAVPHKQFCRTEADGAVSMHLSCWHTSSGHQMTWTQVVTAAQVHDLVRAYVDNALCREPQDTA